MKIVASFILVIVLAGSGCSPVHRLTEQINRQHKNVDQNNPAINIDSLVAALNYLSSREREQIIVPLMLAGNIPTFNFDFRAIEMGYTDSLGKNYKAVIFVSPDYLCLGNKDNFMRMPLTPQAAQKIADRFHAVLPTSKMVDQIYRQSDVKLQPQPLTEKRDSFQTFLRHHNMIQASLSKNAHPLVAGIKKDIVQTVKINNPANPNRVAIYGWHQLNGTPIQPLYTGHVDWYVDYSHGVRLVYEKMIIDGRIVFMNEVLNDPVLSRIICDEGICGVGRYTTFVSTKEPKVK